MQPFSAFITLLLLLVTACNTRPARPDTSISDPDARISDPDANITAPDGGPGVNDCTEAQLACGSSCCDVTPSTIESGVSSLRIFGAVTDVGAGELLYSTDSGAFLLPTESPSSEPIPQGNEVAGWLNAARGANLLRLGEERLFGLFSPVGIGGEIALLRKAGGAWTREVVVHADEDGFVDAVPYLRDADGLELWVRGARLLNGDIDDDRYAFMDGAWTQRESFYSGRYRSGVLHNALDVVDTREGRLRVSLVGTEPHLVGPDGESFLSIRTTSIDLLEADHLADLRLVVEDTDGIYLLRYPFDDRALASKLSPELPADAEVAPRTPIRVTPDSDGNLHLCYSVIDRNADPRNVQLHYVVQHTHGTSHRKLTDRGFGCHITAAADGATSVLYGSAAGDDTWNLMRLRVAPAE